MKSTVRRLLRFVISLAAAGAIFYSAYSANAVFIRRSAVTAAQAACQEHSGDQSPNPRSDCSPEHAIALERAIFDQRMAKAQDPLTLGLMAIGCLLVVGVVNLLIG